MSTERVESIKEEIRQKELSKLVNDHAKSVVKAIIEHRKACQQAIMMIFNDEVMSRSILIELSSRMGEWTESKHYVAGYDPGHTLQGARSTSEDDGRRRFEVAKERGYICECFAALEEIFASKSRP
ncbi:MAG: hypothetical protein ACK56F_13590, partial [bacterium]